MLRFVQLILLFLPFTSYALNIPPTGFFKAGVHYSSVEEWCQESLQTTLPNQYGNYKIEEIDTVFRGSCFIKVGFYNEDGFNLYALPRREDSAMSWNNCLYVDGNTLSCRSSFPSDFDDYNCGLEQNTWDGLLVSPLNVCTKPPPCVGKPACYAYAYDNNQCQISKDRALSSPFSDYFEDAFDYTDNYNFFLNCGLSGSDRTVDTDSADADTPFNPTDLEIPSAPIGASGGGGTSDPTGGGGSGGNGTGNGSGDSTDNNSSDDLAKIDDSNIINAIDNQTSMINTQLNSIDNNIVQSSTNNLDAINAQTTMLNEQLNNIGNAISDTDNDTLILKALNNQIQTTEDVIDAINNIDISASVDFPDNIIITDDPYISNIDNLAHEASMSDFYNRLGSSPIVSSLNNIKSAIHFNSGSCNPFKIDLRQTLINKVISTNILCDLIITTAPIVSPVMLVVFSFIGFRVFASA